MTEIYPTDAELLATDVDTATGIELIPTGQTPYYLSFRKLMQRLMLVAQRGNDFRVYADGPLTFGMRAGRCVIQGQSHDVAALVQQSVATNAVTHVWIDSAGALQTATDGLPTDRSSLIPLASITTDDDAITELIDLRSEAIFNPTSLNQLGLSTTAQRIDEVLDGTNASVNANALNGLTAGSNASADPFHTHFQVAQDVDGYALFTLFNLSDNPGAELALVFSVPEALPEPTALQLNRNTGFLEQTYNGEFYNLVGVCHVQHVYPGALSSSQTNQLVGTAPIAGAITHVILSAASNLVTDESADHITATVKNNGTTITATHPQLHVGAGTGFRSTDQSHGTASVMKTDGSQLVQRGDVITVDLTRQVTGSLTSDASDLVVLLIIRAAAPE